jgi:hypothetical protein
MPSIAPPSPGIPGWTVERPAFRQGRAGYHKFAAISLKSKDFSYYQSNMNGNPDTPPKTTARAALPKTYDIRPISRQP